MNLVFMGKNAAQWLMKDVEHIVVGVNPKQFFTFRGGGGILHTLFNKFQLLWRFFVIE